MKKGFYILMMIGVVILISSCGKSQRTYTEMLKDERKAINRLIDREGIVVLDEYPENGVFGENEFVKLESGLYLNVVDSGKTKATLGSTKIFCRFIVEHIDVLNDTTYVYDGFANATYPLLFTLGVGTDSDSYYKAQPFSYYYSSGLQEPLVNKQYVGDSAIVKLIVPFKIGGEAQNTGGDPIYIKKLRYVFEK